MIKRSYIFIAIGIGIFAIHRKMDAMGKLIDGAIFVVGLVLIALGLYLRYSDRKKKAEVEDFD